MNIKIPIISSIVLLSILVIPASAQSSPDHIVINEVDINPPGDDSTNISEWVEIYNPTNSEIDLSGWEIASTTVLKKTLTIPDETIIEPGKFITYSYQPIWFTDVSESVELRDETGNVIDKTPLFSDLQNNFSSWQRIFDGYDTDSINDWKFETSNAGSTNGKQDLVEVQEGVSVTLFTDSPTYLFGQTVVISGSVSEEVVITTPYFQPEKIILTITGPDYNKIVELYPDLNLDFKTTMSLHQVLGVNPGTYNLSVSYAGATSQTSFTVGNEVLAEPISEISELNLITDKSQYIPGQTITITGTTSEIIPFEGLNFNIKDPSGNMISSGNLFPTDGKFTTTVFLTTVSPVYGTYEIIGEYSDKSVNTTFEVVEDFKEETPISLWTDREAYGLGNIVEITGRLNDIWISSIDLEIIQTKNIALSSSGSDSGFKILDSLEIQGDGSFSYSFKIPDNELRLGDYKITVSKEIGSASVTIHAITNPEEFIRIEEPLKLSTTKSVYDLGDTLIITGFIENPSSRSSFETDVVHISISNEDGTPLQIIALPDGAKTRQQDGIPISYEFTAVPTPSGSFSVQTPIAKNIFQDGTYLIEAEYLDLTKAITVRIIDPLKLSDGASISLNKEVFGLGEPLILNGIIPPSGDTAVIISVTKPDGSEIKSGATVDQQRFTWTWTTPISEKPATVKSIDDRSVSKTNYGIYKINFSTDTYGKDIFFKVSPTPESDSLEKSPLFVSTEKSLYRAGEKLKVIGNVITREQGNEGLVVPDRVTLRVLDGKFPYDQIHQAQVYPNQGGQFESLFELPPTIFPEGEYKVNALYENKKAESTFSVANDFLFGSDEPVSLLLSTDKTQYYPGDVVVLSGKPSKLIYLEKFDVSVTKKSDTEITCGSFFCGVHVGEVTTIRPSPSGSFTYQFPIPDSSESIGTYEMTVDADFETKSILFNVSEQLETQFPSTVIEKQNRIPDSQISIMTEQKRVDDNEIAPRVITGSLLTSMEDQKNVNLRISSESGVCIIGPEVSCLVQESTRKPGQIYEVVTVDEMNLKVRYSGQDVRLEKFDILPESSDVFLPDSTWHVDVVKEDQVSRFYYKVNYKTLE